MINPQLFKAWFCCLFILCSSYIALAQRIEQKQDFKNFNAISVSSGIKLYLTQAGKEDVVLKGDKDALEKIKISKDASGHLKIGFKTSSGLKWGNWKSDDIEAHISFKTLNSVSASGGSDVFSTNHFDLKDLTINASGGSDISFTLDVANLKIATAGGSDIKLKGKTTNLSIAASGGSDILAYNFRADNVKASLSGGCDAELFAAKALTVQASGASDVYYKGNPKTSINTSGGSDAKQVK